MASRLALAAVAALLVVATAYYALQEGEPEELGTVRVATLAAGISTLDIIENRSIGAKYGVNVEVVRLGKTPEIASALARGDVDVAVIPVEYVARWVMEGNDLVIIAVEMMQNQAILAVDEDIETPEDLVGRVVGAFFPTSTYNTFKAYMKLVYGIDVVEIEDPGEAREDAINTINIPPGTMITALLRGDVDAIVAFEPIVSEAIARGAHVVAEFSDLYYELYDGEPVMLVYAARGDWARANPSLVKALAEARAEAAVIWDREEEYVASLITWMYKISPEAADILVGRVEVYTEAGVPDEVVASIANVLELAYRGGFLPEDPAGLLERIIYGAGG